MSGPRPTPTHLKLIRGNPGRRPINKNEPVPPQPPKIPDPPAFLSAIAKEEWARVAPELYALHLLTTVDTAALAVYCQAYSQWRVATEMMATMAAGGLLIRSRAGEPTANPLIWIANSAVKTMLRSADLFGMSPAARSRINGGFSPPPRGPSKFGDLLA